MICSSIWSITQSSNLASHIHTKHGIENGLAFSIFIFCGILYLYEFNLVVERPSNYMWFLMIVQYLHSTITTKHYLCNPPVFYSLLRSFTLAIRALLLLLFIVWHFLISPLFHIHSVVYLFYARSFVDSQYQIDATNKCELFFFLSKQTRNCERWKQ